ncbi:major capsid protein P2 [Cupriavidus sp. H39]|uniref:major capsid protein P2 n=1 Tax=Cupriavidus sp. H39 TaxID=3401635 RepID=UPI003D05515D
MSIIQQLPPFLNVVANGVATLQIPRYANTLNRVVLNLLGTTFTKAMIADIKVKIGARTVYNISGTRLDAINKYKGIFDAADFLTIDFNERDAPSIDGKEVGGYDMTAWPDNLNLEITIAGATAPQLTGYMILTPPQGQGAGELIHKLLYFPASTSVAGKFPINFSAKGALIKRVHMFYSGTDWTATTDGNVNRVEVKKNGLIVWDATSRVQRFIEQEQRKVPQSKHYCVDFIYDNNQSGALKTADAAALEFNAFLTAADGLDVYVEVIDLPFNL